MVAPVRGDLARGVARLHVAGMSLTRARNPGTAAVLSFFIPGLGQIYNGAFLRGIFWLIITPGAWWASWGMAGWVCHLIAAYTAYTYAENHARR